MVFYTKRTAKATSIWCVVSAQVVFFAFNHESKPGSLFCSNQFHRHFNWISWLFPLNSYDTTSRRKQPDRSKRSNYRRSPTSSRHPNRQRYREERDERSQSTTRRRHRDRVVKDRTPVKVKPIQYLNMFLLFLCQLFVCSHQKHTWQTNWRIQPLRGNHILFSFYFTFI